jgi:hypothetical protein
MCRQSMSDCAVKDCVLIIIIDTDNINRPLSRGEQTRNKYTI